MKQQPTQHLDIEAKDFFKHEMIEKLKAILPYTPVDLVAPIYDYWSSSKMMADKAIKAISH